MVRASRFVFFVLLVTGVSSAHALSRIQEDADAFKKIVKTAPTENRVANGEIPADDALSAPSANDEIKVIKKAPIDVSPAPQDATEGAEPPPNSEDPAIAQKKTETETKSDSETEAGANADSGDTSSIEPQISISTHAATKASGKSKSGTKTAHDAKSKLLIPVAEEPEAAGSVTAEQSLKWLTNGNVRYMKKHFRADGRSQIERSKTIESQHPHAIVLSCSDSRVPPELIFDQGIGEIYTVRALGEALDDSVIGSLEYAVEHYGIHLLVVMGHTKCDAVDSVLNSKEGDSGGSEPLDHIWAEIRPHLKSRSTEKPSANLEVESALNADGIARDLVTRSEILRKKVESGELKIKSALYWIDSGKVKFY